MIKLVVFDWNGTLLADFAIVFEAFNREISLIHPKITKNEYLEKREVPLWRFYENLGVDRKIYDTNIRRMTEAFHDYYEPMAQKARTRSGCRTLLQALSDKKIASCILSNHPTVSINNQLIRLKIAEYFETVLGNDDVHQVHSVSKERHLYEYLKTSDHNPNDIAIVGDTIEEVEIGQNLGIKTIAITGGYNSTKRLKAAKPDVLVHSLHEIIPIIEEL